MYVCVYVWREGGAPLVPSGRACKVLGAQGAAACWLWLRVSQHGVTVQGCLPPTYLQPASWSGSALALETSLDRGSPTEGTASGFLHVSAAWRESSCLSLFSRWLFSVFSF